MKSLYLVRHAKSDWSLTLPDRERTLNQRGQIAAPMMGTRLLERSVMPDVVFSSPAVRAGMTARLITEKMGYPVEKIRELESIYNAEPMALLDVIHSLASTINSAMLVGHNPGMTLLADALSNSPVESMSTCAICALEFDIDDWSDVDESMGRCVFFEKPKQD